MAQLFYTPFTVQTGQVSGTLTNFAVLLSLNDTRFKTTGNGGHVASSSGFDLRPYSDSALTNALTYELAAGTYSATGGTAEIWVNIASLADGAIIYLGYGDTSLTTDGSSTATWDSAYKGVWHLPNGSSLTAGDSTSGGFGTGTITAATATAGKIDGGASFNGSTAQVDFGTPTINYGKATFSMWFHEAAVDHGGTAFTQWQDTPESNDCFILDSLAEANGGGTGHARFVLVTNGVSQDHILGNTAIDDGNWHYVVGVYTQTQLLLYVDGASDATAVSSSGSNINLSTLHMYFGRYTNGAFFKGLLDELRISNTNRSAGWISTEYNNQNAPGTFYSVGTEVSLSSDILMGQIIV